MASDDFDDNDSSPLLDAISKMKERDEILNIDKVNKKEVMQYEINFLVSSMKIDYVTKEIFGMYDDSFLPLPS